MERIKSEYLVGKKVIASYIHNDKESIKINLEDEFVLLDVYADCCSESWIEHVSGFDDLKNKVITSYKEVDIGEGAATKQDYDQLYSVNIKFDGSYISEAIIEFRNSSNGYYGGYIELFKTDSSLKNYSEILENV